MNEKYVSFVSDCLGIDNKENFHLYGVRRRKRKQNKYKKRPKQKKNQTIKVKQPNNPRPKKIRTPEEEEERKRKIRESRARARQKYKENNPYWNLNQKLKSFNKTGINKYNIEYTLQDVINYFGPNPVCYLTGKPIDLTKQETFSLDHFIPRSKGGDNSLSNMKLCHPKANLIKSDMNIDELFQFCMDILKYNKIQF